MSYGRSRPELSCVLLTDRLNAQSANWFAAVKQIADELVIFVDALRADGETRAWASRLATRLYYVNGQGHLEPHLREMFLACRGEWVLRLDSDEELSSAWYSAGWWEQIAAAEHNYYWLPRRWLHPDGGFIDCEPWWRDPQARLFRNEPNRISFPELLHEPMVGDGEAGELPSLAIHHHVLCSASRSEREAKVARYKRIRPEKPLGHYYLFEDAKVTTAQLPPDDWSAESKSASQLAS
ncbi:MAG: hypothetical protein ACJ8JD_01115 [Chthoniobacterales bacterium]